MKVIEMFKKLVDTQAKNLVKAIKFDENDRRIYYLLGSMEINVILMNSELNIRIDDKICYKYYSETLTGSNLIYVQDKMEAIIESTEESLEDKFFAILNADESDDLV